MDPTIWAKAHGATTHFPLALALSSVAFDAAGFALARKPVGSDLRAAGYWTMIFGAMGTVPAVLSGLMMTKGTVMGHDALRLHHLFVWPAFALLIGLARGQGDENRDRGDRIGDDKERGRDLGVGSPILHGRLNEYFVGANHFTWQSEGAHERKTGRSPLPTTIFRNLPNQPRPRITSIGAEENHESTGWRWTAVF